MAFPALACARPHASASPLPLHRFNDLPITLDRHVVLLNGRAPA